MNGPSHYRAAEGLLSDASFRSPSGEPVTRDGWTLDPAVHAAMLDRALVHATLALAAATALGVVSAESWSAAPEQDVTAWMQSVSASPHWGETDPLADVQVGDPDPCPDDVDSRCRATGPDLWVCTRPTGHPGQHIAEAKVVWSRLSPGGSR